MINKVNASGLYFKRIEMLTPTSVKAAVTDTLLCQGECNEMCIRDSACPAGDEDFEVVDQYPKEGTQLSEGNSVCLYSQ